MILLKNIQKFVNISLFNFSSAKAEILTGNITAGGSSSHFLVMKIKNKITQCDNRLCHHCHTAGGEKLSFQSENLTSVSAVSSLNSSTITLEGAVALSMSDFEVIILG